jgi:hypothetical protein
VEAVLLQRLYGICVADNSYGYAGYAGQCFTSTALPYFFGCQSSVLPLLRQDCIAPAEILQDDAVKAAGKQVFHLRSNTAIIM